jgi:hypothetical protein
MRLRDILTVLKAQKKSKNSPTVLKINEFCTECKTLTYKIHYRRWINFYDIETVFQYMLMDSTMTDFTIEIMIRLKQAIEEYQKNVKSNRTPWIALKIIIDVARKSRVI